jgi:mono/diheme cytochrome c family protein
MTPDARRRREVGFAGAIAAGLFAAIASASVAGLARAEAKGGAEAVVDAPSAVGEAPRGLRGDPQAHILKEIARAKAAGLGRTTPVESGRRIFAATGGCTCHTNYPGEGPDAPSLAGGRALETPFGIYYSTNITPDPETGIGGWSLDDFVRAMREGLSPAGEHYFPVFPYTAFTGLSDQDLADLKSYLDSLPAIRRENRPHDAHLPFSFRPALAGWKWLNFVPARVEDDPALDPATNRGRYLALAAAHCGECHTPRTLSGGLDRTRWLAGSRDGPEGELAPNITPDEKTGIGDWSIPDLVWYLETGLKPDGDDTQGLMSEVIRHGYANLSREDREAIARYVKSVPAIENRVRAD